MSSRTWLYCLSVYRTSCWSVETVLVLCWPVRTDRVDVGHTIICVWVSMLAGDAQTFCETSTEKRFCTFSIAKGGREYNAHNFSIVLDEGAAHRECRVVAWSHVNYHVACVRCGFWAKVILVIQVAVPDVYMVSFSLYVMSLIVKTLPLFVYL